jgi:hypothetical protein
MPSEHAVSSVLSTFYHFLPPLPMHLAGSQAIPPFFKDLALKKTFAANLPRASKNHPRAPDNATITPFTGPKFATGRQLPETTYLSFFGKILSPK